jgi:anti-sigma-K factor RskA
MTEAFHPTPEQDAWMDCGEYVLGTLDAAALTAFEAAMASDSLLLAEVYRWQDRLLGLTAQVAPAARLMPSLWPAIEARLGQSVAPVIAETARAVGTATSQAKRSPALGNKPAAPLPPWAQNSPAPALPAAGPYRQLQAANDALFARLRWWQITGSLAVAASVVMACLLLLGQRPGQTIAAAPQRYLTMLQGPGQSEGWIVEITANDKLRLVPVGPPQAVPPGKTLQFWTKLDGAAGPTSLGLVQPGQAIEIPLTKLPGVAEKQLFELTLEPEAGSPIDKPTGPILFIGRSVRL